MIFDRKLTPKTPSHDENFFRFFVPAATALKGSICEYCWVQSNDGLRAFLR